MDIVERLGELRLGNKEYDVVVDAIDEIELLRKERDGLREALKEISALDEVSVDEFQLNQWLHQRIARAALKENS